MAASSSVQPSAAYYPPHPQPTSALQVPVPPHLVQPTQYQEVSVISQPPTVPMIQDQEPNIMPPEQQPPVPQPARPASTTPMEGVVASSSMPPPAVPPPRPAPAPVGPGPVPAVSGSAFPDLNSPVQAQFTKSGKPKGSAHSRDRSRSQDSRGSSPRAQHSFTLVERKKKKRATSSSRELPATPGLPGRFSERNDGSVTYLESGSEPVVFYKPKATSVHPRLHQFILHATNPIGIVKSLERPLLPKPGRDMPHGLKSNFRICLPPRNRRQAHSIHSVCDCIAILYSETNHRIAFVPNYCAKRGFVKNSQMEISPPVPASYWENSQHAYAYDPELRAHVLALPQPFAISPRWPSKTYKPAFSSCTNSRLLSVLSILFNDRQLKSLGMVYMGPPDGWTALNHPYFAEPDENSELFHTTRDMYGVETFARTALVQHPCRPASIYLWLFVDANDTSMTLPVLEPMEKFGLDDFIAGQLSPFYADGQGRVLCPVCLIHLPRNSDAITPAFYSRSEWIVHWRASHWNHSWISGLATPTQLHTRTYMGMFLYTLCLAHRPSKEDPSAPAASPFLHQEGLSYTDTFARILKLPTRAAQAEDVLGRIVDSLNNDEMGHMLSEEDPPELDANMAC